MKQLIEMEKLSANNLKTNNMENRSYSSTISVNKAAHDVFKAIQNFRGWWSQEVEGNTDKIGQTFFYHYKDVHLCKIKLVEMQEDKRLVYQIVDNEFNFTKDKTEWINTRLIFELQPEDSKTKIVFTHKGLVPEYECYAVCNDAWTSYIQGSLKDFIETGTGKTKWEGRRA